MDISPSVAADALSKSFFNLIRRGADGSLTLSVDKWQADGLAGTQITFRAQAPEADPLALDLTAIERVAWDRLPRQQVRSQVRFYLVSGDLWTFSGTVDESLFPAGTE